MKKRIFAVVGVVAILLSVLAVLPVMSELGDGNVTNVSETTDDMVVSAAESGAPTSGRWIGTTSQGKDVSFIVVDTQVYNFTISYDYSCTGSSGYGTIKNNVPIDIVGNVFQDEYHLSDDSRMIYGEFTTSNSATGTFRKTWTEHYPYEDTCDSGNISWSARRVQTTGDININEIMYAPTSAWGGYTNEWIELYNNDTKEINIADWTIEILKSSGEQVGVYTIPPGTTMEPESYAILARKPDKFNDKYNVTCPVLEVPWGNLPNDGGTIILNDSSTTLINRVNYTEYADARLAKSNNKTLELNATGGWEESLVDGGTPCRRNSVLGTPPQVTNASANPPIIAVNTDITELRVDVAGIESPIDVVTVDLSPIGGNASTVMFNIGNYTQDNISWTMYNYTTNASVKGTFNLTVNSTDINGNYNDTVSIMLDVKKTVIHFTTFPAMTYISNISVDANVLGNVGKNATTEQFTSTEEIDNETYYIVNTTKPVGSTEMYVGVDEINEDLTMKRRVREREPGVEVANLTYDPEFVSRDFPLWVGKNWTTTTNVTGMLVNRTGVEMPIDTIAVVSGAVTGEVNLIVPYGTIHCLVVEVNVNLQDPPASFLTRYWLGYDETNEMLIIPKSRRYSNENLMEELELIEIVAP